MLDLNSKATAISYTAGAGVMLVAGIYGYGMVAASAWCMAWVARSYVRGTLA